MRESILAYTLRKAFVLGKTDARELLRAMGIFESSHRSKLPAASQEHRRRLSIPELDVAFRHARRPETPRIWSLIEEKHKNHQGQILGCDNHELSSSYASYTTLNAQLLGIGKFNETPG